MMYAEGKCPINLAVQEFKFGIN